MIVIFLLVSCLLAFYHYFFHSLGRFRRLGIPHLNASALLRTMASFVFRQAHVGEVMQRIYNLSTNALYVGILDQSSPMIMVRDPELIKYIATKNFDHFTDHRSFVTEDSDSLFSKILFSLRGDRWRKVRAVVTPAVAKNRIKNMFQAMSECASRYSDYMARLSPEQREMNVKDIFTRYTNDVIATCIFGIEVDSTDDPKNDFYVHSMQAARLSNLNGIKFFVVSSLPRLSRFLGLYLVGPRAASFFRDVIATTIKVREQRGIYRPDMIHFMMETRRKDSTQLTIDDMSSQAFGFFFGGFESSATLMSFVAYELAIEPEVQARAREEIDKMLEETGGEITYEAVNGLEFLDAVLNETLRLFPVNAGFDRVCVKDFELPPALPGLKPYTVKSGSNVWMPVYALQRDPKYFENPDTFNPDRFLGEGKKILNSGVFLPFGLGPRMCLGNRFALLQTKVLLVHLLARCEIKRCAKTRVPIKLCKASVFIIPEGDYWVRIEPRINPHSFIAKLMANGTAKCRN